MKYVVQSLALSATVMTMTIMSALPASGQMPPIFDMKGTWTAKDEAIVDGGTTHHPANASGQAAGARYKLASQVLTWKIEGQDGRRFWGTISSEHSADNRWMGSISLDGKQIYFVGPKGFGDGTIVDADKVQVCFREITPETALVGCAEMHRQK